MSAVYKVMEQMQKTRPRRLRGNREVMIVLGGIIIVGMLMLVSSLNKRLAADNRNIAQAQPVTVKVGAIDPDQSLLADALVVNATLNEHKQWLVADRGVVNMEQLLGILIESRNQARQQGLRSVVRAHISGDQPAKHFMDLHRVAEEAGMDQVDVVSIEPMLEDEAP